jgi:DNA-binding response OmpR family regulator
MARRTFIGIVGHGPELEREEGAATILRGLGAHVCTLDLWDEPHRLFPDDEREIRALIVEALERPDLAVAALRALRQEPRLESVGAMVALEETQIARIEPSSGFDDFILAPYVPAELYARIRRLEWRRSEFVTEERLKIGAMVVDRAAREVLLDGARVPLTAREFALLAYLAERRGKAFTREELLRRVWGSRYEGSARTVDIHVRRLRAKLGPALPLMTLHGTGYKLEAHVGGGPPLSPPRPAGRALPSRGERDDTGALAVPARHAATTAGSGSRSAKADASRHAKAAPRRKARR